MTDARTLAELFRVPPEQFTAARNRLVAELRRAGKAPAAAAIARLPRPTLVVWAINQAAQQDRAAVDRLLAAADELKNAQLGRARTAVPVAAKAYHDAVAALVERSLGHAAGAGHATTAAARNRLTGTLMAAATDPALRQPLREGRLSREHATAGFDVFRDAPPALRVVKPSAAPRPEIRQAPGDAAPEEDREEVRRQAQARVRLATARADLAQAESRAEELAKTEAELRKVAGEARQRAAAARRAASQGREEVARARAKVTEAEKAARDR
jgi:hypothetical protein